MSLWWIPDVYQWIAGGASREAFRHHRRRWASWACFRWCLSSPPTGVDLQVLDLLADKERARDVRSARVEYMSRRRGMSTSLVLEPPPSVHSVKSFAVNFFAVSTIAIGAWYRADHRHLKVRRKPVIHRSAMINSTAPSDSYR